MRINLALFWLIRTPLVHHYNFKPSKLFIRNKSIVDNKSMSSESNLPKFVDIGANLTDSTYQGYYHHSKKHRPDLDKVLERARNVGVNKIMVTSGCLEEVNDALKICNEYDKECKFLYTTVGVHPTRCNAFVKNKFNKTDTEYLDTLDQLISNNRDRVVAIGEFGLDYDRLKFCDQETQKKYFEFQFSLVEKYKLPLFLHSRNSDKDFIDIMRRNKDKWASAGGVVHSYTGDIKSLKELLEEDLYIGVNGCSLKTEENLNTVKNIPLDRLLLETDCPWCGIKFTHSSSRYVKTKFDCVKRPEAVTGVVPVSTRNEPCYILNVAEVVHQLICPEMEFNEFCDRVYQNTVKLFSGLNKS